jgi:hypothetical protein
MPQEISVSYQAIKSKVYRLIDALVTGEKSEADVQESIRRWWCLIHPADRPIAQKYLLMVLEKSTTAMEAVGDGLATAAGNNFPFEQFAEKRLKVMDRMAKEASVRRVI